MTPRVVCIWFDGTDTWVGMESGGRWKWSTGNQVVAASHAYMS